MKKQVEAMYADIYGDHPHIRTFFAPGRINLIGEHIDYNGGYVLPAAISLGNYLAVVPREDQTIRMYSAQFPDMGVIQVSLDQLDYRSKHSWANYVKGIIQELVIRKYPIHHGFDLVITGNLPRGVGLSSSASIEVLVATMMNHLFQLSLSKDTIVEIAQYVENHYIHVQCGIMDQFAITFAQKNHAMLLHSTTQKHDMIPLNLAGYNLVVVNSKKERSLIDSQYNARKNECEKALIILKPHFHVKYLCDIDYESFMRHLDLFKTNDVYLRRARHVITENLRTRLASDALMQHDLHRFGELMLESHYSLKSDYEVTSAELDALVELGMNSGSIGSRMMGAGFGGVTLHLVKDNDFARFARSVSDGYHHRFGIEPDIFIIDTSDGAHELIDVHE